MRPLYVTNTILALPRKKNVKPKMSKINLLSIKLERRQGSWRKVCSPIPSLCTIDPHPRLGLIRWPFCFISKGSHCHTSYYMPESRLILFPPTLSLTKSYGMARGVDLSSGWGKKCRFFGYGFEAFLPLCHVTRRALFLKFVLLVLQGLFSTPLVRHRNLWFALSSVQAAAS